MKPEHALKLISALGSHGHINGEWASCSCPLAQWTHKSHKDSTPSFGINLKSNRFNCFTCFKGSLDYLMSLIQLYIQTEPGSGDKVNLSLAREIIEGVASEVDPLPEYTEFSAETTFQPWPDYYLDQFGSVDNHKDAALYLHGRGLTKETIERFDLRVDATYGRIVCPFRNVFGRLAGARGRAYRPDSKLKHFDYTWNKVNNSSMVLFNEQSIAAAYEAGKPVVVVEGQFDCMKVSQVYPFVVANLTAKPTPAKLKRLQTAEHGVISFLDRDETGKAATEAWARGLKDHVPFGTMEYPEGLDPVLKDPGSLSDAVLHGLFDELL